MHWKTHAHAQWYDLLDAIQFGEEQFVL